MKIESEGSKEVNAVWLCIEIKIWLVARLMEDGEKLDFEKDNLVIIKKGKKEKKKRKTI